ncbi:hypothetical protein KC333_g205 [Hortaea werneckii]|nr:hypothetical protein KC333_g205 [Hortaea werneckii]
MSWSRSYCALAFKFSRSSSAMRPCPAVAAALRIPFALPYPVLVAAVNSLIGSGECGRSFVFSNQVRRVLRQFGYRNERCKVSEVRAFVVETHKTVVLRIVSSSERAQSFVVAERGMHGSQHARDELVDAIALGY